MKALQVEDRARRLQVRARLGLLVVSSLVAGISGFEMFETSEPALGALALGALAVSLSLAWFIGRRTEAAHAQLAESEARFRSLTALSSDWYWEQDASFRFTLMSGGLLNKGNFAIAKVLGKTRWELPIELSESEWASHRETLEAHRAFGDFEYKILTENGSMRYYSAHGEPIFDDHGGFKGYRGTANDVTERKRAEDETRQSKVNLRAIAENATAGITIFQDGRRVFANRRAAEMLGYTVEEFLTLALGDVVHPESRELVLDRYRRRAAGEDVPSCYEFTALAKDGRAIPVEGSYTVTEWNGRPAIMAFAADITERGIAQSSLRQSEANLRALTDNATFGIVVLQDGRRIFSNPRAAELVGYTTEEFTRLSINDHIHPDDRDALLERRRRRLAGESVPAKVEFTVLAKDGRAVPLEAHFATTTWNGQPARILFTTDITERKRAEDNLRRFRAAIDVTADFVLLIDPATMRYIDVNETACRALGYSREELLAMGPQDVFSATREELAKVYARLLTGDLRETAAEGWYRRKDGSRLLVESFRHAVPYAKGHAIIAIARDVNERKVTENALRLLSTGMANLRGGAFFNEVAGRVAEYLEADIGFVTKLQAPANTRVRTLGLCIDRQIVPPLEFDLAHTPCEAVIGEQPTIVQDQVQQLFPAFRMAADLGVSSYAAVPLVDTHGNPIGAVGVMSRAPLRQPAERIEALLRLFAVRTAAEIEHQGAEAKFKDLFEFATDACLIVDQAGRITLANHQAEITFGYTGGELLGLSVDSLIPEGMRARHAGLRRDFFAAATSRPMGSGRIDLLARRKDGTTFPVDIDLHALQTDDGIVVVATVRNMTAQRQEEERRSALELQLRQSQKMEAVGTLAGGIAHDFNNIIGAILGNAALAREDVGADHPALESITEISKAGRRARDLVQQILAFSRKQAVSRNVIALGPVVQEAVKLLQATLPAGVRITSDCVTGLPNVSADPTQIHQVLVNLCTNAWHAMEGRPGHIDIRLEEVTVDAEFVRAHAGLRAGRCVRLSVRDTGKGMDAAMLERIFEPFFTTKPVDEGTGLGLSVVHGIMQGHEGGIVVDSAPGKGTAFHLYFPAVDAPAGAHRAAAAVPPLPQALERHVLYLDDDEALVSLVSRMLERQGYRVSGHTQAQQALDAVRADPGGFDLVVSDYNMPGMSGLDVAREIALLRPDLPVAVTSGYITDELREKAPTSGVRHLIYKPDTVDELCEVVRRLTSPIEPPFAGKVR